MKTDPERWGDDPEAVARMGDIGNQILQLLIKGVQGPDEAITTIIGVLACIYENQLAKEGESIEELVEDIKLGLNEYLGSEDDNDPGAVH